MKSTLTTVLAGLMLLGTISAIATPKNSVQTPGYADGGPVPLCNPLTNPNCPSTNVKAKLTDGGPVPLCNPLTNPNCPVQATSAK